MLINRKIREAGYIFATSLDINYLKAMKNLGLKPIIKYNDPKETGWKLVAILDIIEKANKTDLFRLDLCTKKDIKDFIYNISRNSTFWWIGEDIWKARIDNSLRYLVLKI